MIYLGIDTGGTFTDFVLRDAQGLRIHKVLSTPHAPEDAILRGISELGLALAELRVIHGSTVATNAVLEGKGVRTAYVTNRGFADLLTIGRQNREQLYNLQPRPQEPPVPRELCLETGGRLAADGTLQEPLTEDELLDLGVRLKALAPRAVAVNMLFSYLDDSVETAIAEVIPPDVFVSLSSSVLPETKEYERGMATWLNAWIGPLVQGYLRRLGEELRGSSVSVMQSSGDTVAAEQAGSNAVRMLLSGPAGGLVAARYIGQQADCDRLLSFDMGGTSTDVAMIDGEPRLTSEGRIGRFPVAVPMVDMHTIGAGGGSVAWLDEGGMLQVGPESAGAVPGPACYGQGGMAATVTDANLVLGRMRSDAFLGGNMNLDFTAAQQAMSRLAEEMGCTMADAAQGIVDIANEHMARALRTISVQRGIDPSGFTLVSFGGAGGLHVCALASALDLWEALVPVHGGVLSALGMLVARPGRQLSHTWQAELARITDEEMDRAMASLEQEGLEALQKEGVAGRDCDRLRSVDLRYLGQAYTLNLPWHDRRQVIADFHVLHEQRYGHRMDSPVELVNIRVAVQGPTTPVSLSDLPTEPAAAPLAYCDVVGCAGPVAHYRRAELTAGQQIQGPAIITEQVATTWLAPGWNCGVDSLANLRLYRQE